MNTDQTMPPAHPASHAASAVPPTIPTGAPATVGEAIERLRAVLAYAVQAQRRAQTELHIVERMEAEALLASAAVPGSTVDRTRAKRSLRALRERLPILRTMATGAAREVVATQRCLRALGVELPPDPDPWTY